MRCRSLFSLLSVLVLVAGTLALSPAVSAATGPRVTGLSLQSAWRGGGASITVSGTGFTSVTAVLFGATKAAGFHVVTPKRITVTVPAHALGTTDVRVVTSSTTSPKSAKDRFAFIALPPPTVSSISVKKAPAGGGTAITIHGKNFTNVIGVTFGTVAAQQVKRVSSKKLTVVVPSHQAGSFALQVTTKSGTSKATSKAKFTFTAAPAIPAAAPAGYTRAFTEDFNKAAAAGAFTKAYSTKFGGYAGCCTTNKQTIYDSNKVLSTNNGSLYYDLHSSGGHSYSAAPIPRSGSQLDFTYGQVGFALRLDSSVGDGYKMAFLLWPKTGQWTNEIDIAEVNDLSENVYSNAWVQNADGSHSQGGGKRTTVNLSDHQYHTFLLDWVPGQVTIYFDGVAVSTYTGTYAPSQAMHLVMQTEGFINQGAVPAKSTATLEVPWMYVNTYNG